MNRPRLALLGASHEDLDRAETLGIDLLPVCRSEQMRNLRPGHQPRRALVMDYRDDPLTIPLIRAVHAEQPIRACLSLTEDGLEPAAAVNQALKLQWLTVDAVRLTRDKAAMRERLEEYGLSPVAARRCADAGAIASFGSTVGFPVVLKPSNGVGSRGVRLVQSTEEAAAAVPPEGLTEPVLVEEYLHGSEYSVESFSFHGRHLLVAITEKTLLGTGVGRFVETGHTVPARLPDGQAEEVWKLTAEVLSVLGLTEGPAHTEVIVTEQGPRIVETHNRVGGDRIRDLVSFATGVDLDILTMAWACGIAEEIREPPSVLGGSAIRFLTPPPGIVEAVVGVGTARSRPGIVDVEVGVGPGDRLPEIRDAWDRSGHVLAVGADAMSAAERCEDALECIDVRYRASERSSD